MLLAARNELAAGRPQGAIEALDRLLARYPPGMDEAFFLYGSALEQSGPLRDIRRAYGYFRKVRDDYPMSPFWDKASERISYIERHYFEIR
jgi:outer membrane protein assembly factor BamD (BamD/ComL family)